MSFALAELERILANLIRYGKITEIDYSTKRVRVSVGELKTDWIPWKERRAGSIKTWSPPSKGEQVIILSPFGDMAQATILTGINSDSNDAPFSSGTVEGIKFSDGTQATYDTSNKTLSIILAEGGKVSTNATEVTVTASSKVTIDTPSAAFTGNLQVDGDFNSDGELTNKGVDVGATHPHSGVKSGPDLSGPPAP